MRSLPRTRTPIRGDFRNDVVACVIPAKAGIQCCISRKERYSEDKMKNHLFNIKSLLPKTITFYWEGINAKGLRVNGFYHDLDKSAILAELKKQTITPLKITKKIFFFSSRKAIKAQDIIDFSRELYTLLNAGISHSVPECSPK